MSHAHDRLAKRFGSTDPAADLQHVRWQIAAGHAHRIAGQSDGTVLMAVVVRGKSGVAAVAPDGFIKTIYPAEACIASSALKYRRWKRRRTNIFFKEKRRADKQGSGAVQRPAQGRAARRQDAERADRHSEVP